VVAVAAGGYHSLFVKTDGTLWAMGYNGDGQLGNGYTSDHFTPVVVASNVVAVTAGYLHSLFVKSDGSLWAMGDNDHGQLGIGSINNQSTPVLVSSNVGAVEAVYYHSLFVKSDGSLWAMGDNEYGQLGIGTTNNSLLPVQVPGLIVASLGAMDSAYHSLCVGASGGLVIFAQPASRTNNAGTTAIFDVGATSTYALLNYEWYKNGVPLSDGGNVSGSSTSTLTLNNVLAGDAGNYSVVITNAFGAVTSSVAILTVNDPAIVTQPASRITITSTTASFSVGASGTTPLSYQWLLAGVPLSDGGHISGSGSATLTLSNVQTADAGNYSVVITNPVGAVTSSLASLTVITSDPFIGTQPVTQLSPPGQNATFSVGAMGLSPLSYQWRKGGVNLPSGTNASLSLGNVQSGDAGAYDVVVNDASGSVTSSVASLKVTLVDTFNSSANGCNSTVYSMAVQPDGKVLVGGNFTTLGGQSRSRIGRLNSDGSWDSSFNNSGANDYVFSLALQPDGKVMVGGNFSSLAGQGINRVGRLNTDGTTDHTFTFNSGTGADSYLRSSLVQADGKILVGGNFTTLVGQSRSRIGRLNADGTLDSTFNPGAGGLIYTLALQPDGKILVGGSFTTLGGQTRNRLGRVNPDGTLDTAFNPGANNTVNVILVQPDGKILVGGSFTTLGGQSRSYIGRLNADGTLDTAFNPGANAQVDCLDLQADGKILVTGYFTTMGGQTRNYLCRLNANGTVDATFALGADKDVLAMKLQEDGKILLGGDFLVLDGQERHYLGRLNNTDPATESLAYNGTNITWLRGGTLPEVWRTTFEQSVDGTNWTMLGAGTRIAGGWSLAGVSVTNPIVRARGYAVSGGFCGGVVETDFNPNLPTITMQPGSRTNTAGTTAIFSVGAGGPSPFAYQWFKNTAPLTDVGNVSGSSSPILTVGNVQLVDAGNYFVVITNAYGAVTSSVASLAVLLPPQGFGGQIVTGGSLQLQFSGTPNYPYILQMATNLTPPVNWQPVLTNPADGTGNWNFTVTNLTDLPAGFYRAVGQ
jgi:uncharacterized delta-60 repeat protein